MGACPAATDRPHHVGGVDHRRRGVGCTPPDRFTSSGGPVRWIRAKGLGGWPVGERLAEAVRRSAPRAAWARHAGRGNGTRRRRDAPSSWRWAPVLLAGACPSRVRPLGDEARSSHGSQRSSFAGPGPWSDMVMDPQWGGRPDDNLRALESCVEGSSTPVAFEVDATALAVADPGRPRPEWLDGAPLGYHLGLVADGATKASVGQLVSSAATSPSASPSGAASAVLLR